MAKIVLAHGILGFGSVLPSQPLDYFNGIHRLYTDLDHEVICPTVAALGSIAARSAELAAQIPRAWRVGTEPIFLLAHSMGGLDCRRMLQTNEDLAERVKRLITVATPHYGSPVADAVAHPAFPAFLSPVQWLSTFFSNDAGALADLQTHANLQDENIPAVEYLCVGCDVSHVWPQSPIFAATAALGGFHGRPNDGVVGLDSASATNDATTLLDTWPVDHGGAIGWPSDNLLTQTPRALLTPPREHIARYTALLERLIA